MDLYVIGVVLLPLIGFLINGILWDKNNRIVSGTIASACVAGSFVLSIIIFLSVRAASVGERSFLIHFYDWIHVDALKVPMAFLIDPLSSIMCLLVTGVGLLIHIFSIGYMDEEKRPAKYFAFLNLFIFNMLILVLGSSLLTTFIGWEGVGLCSYLLIGYWFEDSKKADAGLKAFLTNRIGDAGFLVGLFFLYKLFGTLNYQDLNVLALSFNSPESLGLLTAGLLGIFIGVCGKSAQIPLYVWLPDAMAGPTPVSALIHAATMVTAGLFVMIRLSNLIILSPTAMAVIATVGALTALIAAIIGTCQWDIKKILAYSTVSQLGYMVLAAGVGAFGGSLFHVLTHAFFKALMFLGAGSIIHALHHEQDIRKMGGLKKTMPITAITFTIGWIAIIGIPPFAGFFSKDEILWSAWAGEHGHFLLWFMGWAAAGLTAFYMTRLMVLTFWTPSRSEHKAHESSPLMTIPLVCLAVLAIFGGLLGIPEVISHGLGIHIPHFLNEWLDEVAYIHVIHGKVSHEIILMLLSVGIAVFGAIAAFLLYGKHQDTRERIVSKAPKFFELVSEKFYVDELYEKMILKPLRLLSESLWKDVDQKFIDGAVNGSNTSIKKLGQGLAAVQNGFFQNYLLFMIVGLIAILTVFVRYI